MTGSLGGDSVELLPRCREKTIHFSIRKGTMSMTLSTSTRARRLVRRRLVAGVAAGFLGMGAALGSGLTTTASAGRAHHDHRHRPRRRRQRDPAHRDLVLLGRTPRRRSSSRRPPSSSTASSPRARSASTPSSRANTVNGGFNRHATIDGLQENTAYSYRVGAEGAGLRRTRSRRRTSRATSTSCSSATRRSARPATWPRTGAGWEDTLNVATRRQPGRRAAGVRR